MKALIDLNVLLDVTLNRPEFVKESAQALGHLVSMRKSECLVAQHAVTTLFYIVRKQCGAESARLAVRTVLKVLKVLPSSRQTLIEASDARYGDYEDAVSFLSAAAAGCDLILTRNPKDFKSSPIPVVTPQTFLRELKHYSRV